MLKQSLRQKSKAKFILYIASSWEKLSNDDLRTCVRPAVVRYLDTDVEEVDNLFGLRTQNQCRGKKCSVWCSLQYCPCKIPPARFAGASSPLVYCRYYTPHFEGVPVLVGSSSFDMWSTKPQRRLFTKKTKKCNFDQKWLSDPLKLYDYIK